MDRAEFFTELTTGPGLRVPHDAAHAGFTAAALADAGARHRRQQRHLQRRQRRAAAVAAVPRRRSPAPGADAVSRRHRVRVAVGAGLHERARPDSRVFEQVEAERHASLTMLGAGEPREIDARVRERRAVRHARPHGRRSAAASARGESARAAATSRSSVTASGSGCSAAIAAVLGRTDHDRRHQPYTIVGVTSPESRAARAGRRVSSRSSSTRRFDAATQQGAASRNSCPCSARARAGCDRGSDRRAT